MQATHENTSVEWDHVPFQYRRTSVPRCGLVGLLALVLFASGASAQTLSTELVQRLAALPPDTETILISQSLKLPPEPVRAEDWQQMLVNGLATGQTPGIVVKLLLTHGVQRAIYASRNHVPLGTFGMYVYEGATIFELRRPIEDALQTIQRRVEDAAGQELDHPRRIIGDYETLVFPSNPVVNQLKPGQRRVYNGNFILQLDPKTVVAATSERFLTEMLKGIKKPRDDKWLNERFELLGQLAKDEENWMMRHVPIAVTNSNGGDATPFVRAVSWTGLTVPAANAKERKDVCRLVYLPAKGKKLDEVKTHVRGFLVKPGEDLHPTLRFEQDDVMLTLSYDSSRVAVDANTPATYDGGLGMFLTFFLHGQRAIR